MPRLPVRSLGAIGFLYVAACGLALAVLAVVRSYAAMHEIDHQVDLRLAAETADILGHGRAPGPKVIADRIDGREAQRFSYGLGYVLVDRSHRRLAGRVSMVLPPIGYSDVDFTDRVKGLEGMTKGRALATRLDDGSILAIVADSDPIDNSDQLVGRVILIGIATSGIVIVIGIWLMLVAIRRRLSDIRASAQAIVDGDMARRLSVTGAGDTLDLEAQTLNGMLDRIAALMGNLKHVSDDIAHDLRTPLARLRNKLVMLSSQAQTDDMRLGLSEAQVECDEILGLFGAILRLSEIDSGRRRAGFASVRLDQLINMVMETFAPSIEDGGRTLAMESVEATEIMGDRVLLSQMIGNAITNAAQHTPQGTKIMLSAGRVSEGVAISVRDDGPGISAADRQHALRRFGRLAEAGGGTGHGLGLTLIDSIARLHHGCLILGDAQPGLVVTMIVSNRAGRSNARNSDGF